MIDALMLGYSLNWTWDPGFRGLLTVAVAVAILCGSVYLILATNTGARLGFMLALTGFCAWMTVMGVIWTLYGIGYKGPAPTWKVVDIVRTEPGGTKVDSALDVAQSLPLPSQMPDPVELRNGDEALLEAFPKEGKVPTLGDLADVDQTVHETLNDKAAPWRLMESSNKYTGETGAAVSEALGPNGKNIFPNAPTDYVVLDSYLTGGQPVSTDDSTIGRVKQKIRTTLNVKPDEFYAVVQVQQVIPQEAKPGQAPPTPVADPDQPVISVVMKREGGHLLRRHAQVMTIFMGLATGLLCWSLHRRDERAMEQRAAVAGAA